MANLTCGLSGVGASAIRVRRLNCDGTVVDIDDPQANVAGYVYCKFSEISLTPETQEGAQVLQNSAAGRPIVNIRRDPNLLGYNLSISAVDVDAEFEEIIGANEGLVTNDDGDTIGGILAGGTQSCDCAVGAASCRDVYLEWWVRGVRCNDEVGYLRYVAPRTRLTLAANPLTWGDATVTIKTFEGRVRPNTQISGAAGGPWADFPDGSMTSYAGEGVVWFTETTLPPGVVVDDCTYISLLDSPSA